MSFLSDNGLYQAFPYRAILYIFELPHERIQISAKDKKYNYE